jgi:SAM-dependent methyltransferase
MEALDAANATFDATLSAFGLIYSTNPRLAIAEAFRVTADDGRVGLATWPRGSFQHEAQSALAATVGDESLTSPWSEGHGLRELLGRHAGVVVMVESTFEWCFPSIADWVAEAERTAPPLVALLKTLEPARHDAVRAALTDVASRFASSAGTGVAIAQQALLAVGWKR